MCVLKGAKTGIPGWHRVAVGSTATSQFEGSSLSFWACSSHVRMGQLQVLWFPPIAKKHTTMQIGYTKLLLECIPASCLAPVRWTLDPPKQWPE